MALSFARYSELLVENCEKKNLYPSCLYRPRTAPQVVTPSEFREGVWYSKLEWLCYSVAKKCVKPFRYNTGTWRTDRRTDRIPVSCADSPYWWRHVVIHHYSTYTSDQKQHVASYHRGEVKVWTLVIAPLTWVRLVTSSALQSRKWQLIGMSQWCRSALCGHPFPALTDSWTHGAASRHTIAPISHTRPSPRSRSYYSFPVPLRVGGWVGLSTQ